MELLDHVVVPLLTYGGSSMLFSIALHQFTFPPTVHKGSLFSTSSMLVISSLVNNSHSDRDEVIVHWCFDLHFPEFQINENCLFSFSLFKILWSSFLKTEIWKLYEATFYLRMNINPPSNWFIRHAHKYPSIYFFLFVSFFFHLLLRRIKCRPT